MKSRNQILKWLALLFVIVFSTMGVGAQTSQTPTQAVCAGNEPYRIDVTADNLYSWSITTGISGTDWTISAPNAASTDILWADPVTGPQTYTVIFRETISATLCYIERTLIVTVNPRPLPPTAANQTVCSDGTAGQTLTATATAPVGSTVVWYTAATGGTVVTAPTQVGVGTITYYAESVAATGTCPSLTRTPVFLTIDPRPLPPTAANQTVCSDGTAGQTLTATATAPVGSTVVWYTAATGGTVVTAPTQVGVGTITYYAESVAATGTCPSLTRTPVVLTIDPAPVPTISGPSPICETITSNVYVTQLGMTNYVWVVSAGGTITSGGGSGDNSVTVTWNTVGAQSVSVNYNAANSCPATTPAVLPITVNPLPTTSPIWHN